MAVSQAGPLNLDGQLGLTQEENAELKAQQINYEIEAIQLNRIDEESIESSDEEEEEDDDKEEDEFDSEQDGKKKKTDDYQIYNNSGSDSPEKKDGTPNKTPQIKVDAPSPDKKEKADGGDVTPKANRTPDNKAASGEELKIEAKADDFDPVTKKLVQKEKSTAAVTAFSKALLARISNIQ